MGATMSGNMRSVFSIFSRDKKQKGAAEGDETAQKVKKLVEMFPMLDSEMISSVLEANEGDIDKTREMFMPLGPNIKEDPEKRPPSRAGPEDGATTARKGSVKDLEELIVWAGSADIDERYQAARAFADLSMAVEQRTRMVRVGALPSLLSLLASPSFEVQRCAVVAIANLALVDEIQGQLSEAGAIPLLVALAVVVEADMQLQVARALANVAFCHEENEAQIVYAGALTPLLSMLADCADTETRVEAVAALANLARSAIAQRRIVEEGGLGPLVSAIQEYPDEEIVKQVLRCLANLLLLPANTGAVRDAPVIETLLAVIRREDASSDAQRLSGMALANLAESKEMQGHMVAVGCLGPIDLLLRSGNEDMELQAARCLASLASHEENKPEIARSIGIPFFIKLAQNRTEKVQILAATCLGHLSTVGGLSASWG
mmetsp:Transcript_64599/g.154143  ORF Transcript_64599/g.154143 Transcript_64599/m.154143 type:complete len:433 (+) Transcript_64599:279-1577(+)